MQLNGAGGAVIQHVDGNRAQQICVAPCDEFVHTVTFVTRRKQQLLFCPNPQTLSTRSLLNCEEFVSGRAEVDKSMLVYGFNC